MVVNYKCPGCGASMVYEEGSACLKCDYCDTTVPVAEWEKQSKKDEAKTKQAKEETKDFHEESGDFRAFNCPNCGAQVLTEEHTAATFCSFCGSPTLVEERLTGEKKPAKLIPFKISKEQAIEKFRMWTKKGPLTPAEFHSQSAMEKITGMYVPFWLYDYYANVQMNVHATRVRTTRRGDTEYIYTDHFNVMRNVDTEYEKVPEDASEKMPDDVMELLEPYNYSDLISFEMPYLSGFLAEKYNFTKEQLKNQAERRVRSFARTAALNTIHGYSSTNVVSEHTNLTPKDITYVMMPVWMLNYTYKGKRYMLTMNGQTGKMVGKLPISVGRAVAWFGGIFAAVFLILTLIGGIV